MRVRGRLRRSPENQTTNFLQILVVFSGSAAVIYFTWTRLRTSEEKHADIGSFAFTHV